jgi:hypothetical protein
MAFGSGTGLSPRQFKAKAKIQQKHGFTYQDDLSENFIFAYHL